MFKYNLLLTPFLLWANPFQGQHQVNLNASSHEMVVSFKTSSQPVLINGKVQFEEKKMGFVIEPPSSFLQKQQFKSLFPLSYAQSMQRAQPYFQASPSSKIDVIKLSGMMEVDVANTPLNELVSLCQQFETLPQVEYCSLNPTTPPPQVATPPASPDYSSQQGYHKDAANGINAPYAWNLGIYGQGVNLRDAEWAWDHAHEDFANVSVGKAQTSDSYANHGTAVVGILMGQHNGFGVKGATPQAQMTTYSENQGRTSAISAMVTAASAGDILILEMQTGGCETGAGQGNYGPPDYSSAVWNLVKSATDAGIIVVSAAGNGNQNLDHSCYQSYRDRGDNGIILVGAGLSSTLGKASFSTYGSKVHLQGWGGGVTTTGYGDLQGTTHKDYTQTFSGTSSATPIVTSAVALVQSWAKQTLTRFLTPSEMRTLLINTGKAQTGAKHIGPLPDVKAAIESLIQQNNLSSTIATSSATSSSNTSSQVSSSLQISSSSANTIDCSSYSAWQSRSYDWSATKEYVVYQGSAYSHTSWVSATVPDQNNDWILEGLCQTPGNSSSILSSAILSSSSTPLLSSSLISSSNLISSSTPQISSNTTNSSSSEVTTTISLTQLTQIKAYGIYTEVEGIAEVISLKGEQKFLFKVESQGFSSWPSPLPSGSWIVKYTTPTQSTIQRLVVP